MVNDHNRELYVRYKSSLIRGRDFLNRQVWRKTSADTLVVVAAPAESASVSYDRYHREARQTYESNSMPLLRMSSDLN